MVCGDQNPPNILREMAAALDAPFYQAERAALPDNGLLAENMHTAVTALMQLQNILPVSESAIFKG